MLYSCTDMATVGVKGLTQLDDRVRVPLSTLSNSAWTVWVYETCIVLLSELSQSSCWHVFWWRMFAQTVDRLTQVTLKGRRITLHLVLSMGGRYEWRPGTYFQG